MDGEELLRRYAAGERNFNGVTIWKASLIEADLRGVNLSNAKLKLAQLICANLSGANMSGINLSGADLTRANLSGANLKGAFLDCEMIGANFYRADLSGSQMYRATLNGAIFQEAILRETDLGCTSLVGTCFLRADLQEAIFDGGGTISADFTEANLFGAIGFVPMRTSIFRQTIMPDGSIRNDDC